MKKDINKHNLSINQIVYILQRTGKNSDWDLGYDAFNFERLDQAYSRVNEILDGLNK